MELCGTYVGRMELNPISLFLYEEAEFQSSEIICPGSQKSVVVEPRLRKFGLEFSRFPHAASSKGLALSVWSIFTEAPPGKSYSVNYPTNTHPHNQHHHKWHMRRANRKLTTKHMFAPQIIGVLRPDGIFLDPLSFCLPNCGPSGNDTKYIAYYWKQITPKSSDLKQQTFIISHTVSGNLGVDYVCDSGIKSLMSL